MIKAKNTIIDLLKSAKKLTNQGKNLEASKLYKEAYDLAIKFNDLNHAAFIQGDLARVKLILGETESAKRELDKSYHVLKSAIDKDPENLFLQIWISNTELGLIEYYQLQDQRQEIEDLRKQVLERAEKFNLKSRKIELKKLLS